MGMEMGLVWYIPHRCCNRLPGSDFGHAPCLTRWQLERPCDVLYRGCPGQRRSELPGLPYRVSGCPPVSSARRPSRLGWSGGGTCYLKSSRNGIPRIVGLRAWKKEGKGDERESILFSRGAGDKFWSISWHYSLNLSAQLIPKKTPGCRPVVVYFKE
jgi:hypothetical protein